MTCAGVSPNASAYWLDDGVLVFKWNETQVPMRDVLVLTPVQPLFGHKAGRKGLTHWYVFVKPGL